MVLNHRKGVWSGFPGLILAMLGATGCGDEAAAGGDDVSPGRDVGGGGDDIGDDAGEEPSDGIGVDTADQDGGTPEPEVDVDVAPPDSGGGDDTSDGSGDEDVETPDADSPDVADVVEPDAEEADAAEAADATDVADAGEDVETDAGGVVCSVPAAGDLLIAEILPSPAMGSAGDANCDATRNAVDDEFVELVNISDGCVNLGGVSLWTESGDARVTFDGSVRLPAGGAVLLFGGGVPVFDTTVTIAAPHCSDLTDCDVVVLTALPGSLALAPNDGFSVRLGETVLDSVTWGTGGVALTANQSLVRTSLSIGAPFENHDQSDRGNISPGLQWATGVCYGE